MQHPLDTWKLPSVPAHRLSQSGSGNGVVSAASVVVIVVVVVVVVVLVVVVVAVVAAVVVVVVVVAVVAAVVVGVVVDGVVGVKVGSGPQESSQLEMHSPRPSEPPQNPSPVEHSIIYPFSV